MTRIPLKSFIKVLFILFLLQPSSVTADSEAVYPAITDRDDWAGTYFKGKKLGFSHVRVRVQPDAILVNSKTYMRLELMGQSQVTSFTQQTELTPDLKLRKFLLLQEISGNRQKVEARLEQNKLIIKTSSVGYDKEKTISFSPDWFLSTTYLLNIYKAGLKVGNHGKFPLFVEPFQMTTELKYRVLRKEKTAFKGDMVNAFVIDQKLSGLQSTLWVAEDGTVIREVSNQGFESRSESEEVAQSMPDGALSVGSFITLSRVKLEGNIKRPRSAKDLTLKVSHLNRPDSIPNDHRQKVLKSEFLKDKEYASTIRIRTEPRQVKKAAPFPVRGFESPEFLADSSEIQSEHILIRTLARELVKDKKSSWDAARAINDWVFNNLEKALVDNFTALDALRSRRGECQSHTNLFTAIARAAGIPTRIVNGLVYSRDFEGFVYHAWPEVYVGEWRALDPTFGQTTVDATHIKLAAGNESTQFKLMEFIGKLAIKVVSQ